MKKRYWVVNQLDNNTAEILIYGNIGMYEDGISASAFITELKELEKNNTKINLRVNSGGGMVYEGIAMFNAIRNSKCIIDGYIDGIAASMASLVVMACRKVYMSKYARLMTHLPSGGAYGNADELRAVADEIDACEQIAIMIYQEKTGLTADQVSQKFLNGKDNFFSAAAAKMEKLIDDIYDGVEIDQISNTSDAKSICNLYNIQLLKSLKDEKGGKDIDESTNFEDLTPEQRKQLFEDNRALYCALFYLEYGKWPSGTLSVEIMDAEIVLKRIKKAELDYLRTLTYEELRKQGKLNRLKNMDLAAYNKACGLDKDGNELSKKTTANNSLTVSDNSNFRDLSDQQKKALYQTDKSLFNALYFLEYGKWTPGLLGLEIKAAKTRLDEIKKKELIDLCNLSFEDLHKQGKLKRLQYMDLASHNRKMEE